MSLATWVTVLTLATASACFTIDDVLGSNEGAPWDYALSSAYGPASWGSIPRDADGVPAFPGCRATARPQSPTGFSDVPVDGSLSALDFGPYIATKATGTVLADGRGLVVAPGGSVISTVAFGHTWTLVGAELHVPGEYAFGGSIHDAEIHLTHESDGSASFESLVVVVPLQATLFGTHAELQKIIEALDSIPTNTSAPMQVRKTGPFDLRWSSLLPPTLSYFVLEGTWTHPPCTAARVVIMADAIQASVSQLGVLHDFVTASLQSPVGNVRPLVSSTPAHRIRRYIDGMNGVTDPTVSEPAHETGTVGRMSIGVAVTAIVMGTFAALALAGIVALGDPPAAPVAQ
jgi:carbonic anhydrase